jgi:hypothetical protein
MRMLIDLWSDPLIVEKEPSWTLREQDALTYLLLNHPTLRRRTGFVHQSLINAFSEGRLFQKYEEGDLLVHFAGCWYGNCCQQLIIGCLTVVQNGLTISGLGGVRYESEFA